MTNEWLITDTHFDHENIGVYCGRPDGWSDKILRNWHQLVKPDDLIIHLGDVMVGHGNLRALMNSLPGIKVLVMGNHDQHTPAWYRRNGFAIAVTALAYKGVTFTHRPSQSLFPGTNINIHGHCHNALWNPSQLFQRLLAIEHENYRPVSFEKWTAMARSARKWAEYRSKIEKTMKAFWRL
jgi:calcineurin-like phosphoesterase family protein